MTGEQTAKACVPNPNPKRNSGAESRREFLSTPPFLSRLSSGRSLVAGREQKCGLVDSLFTTLATFSQNVEFPTA